MRQFLHKVDSYDLDLDTLCDLGPRIYNNSTGTWDLEYEIPTSVQRALGEWARTNSPVTYWYNKMSPHRAASSYTRNPGYFDQVTEDPG